MNKLLKILGVLAFVAAAAVYPVIAGLASGAVAAYIIPAKDPATVELERTLFDPKGMDKASPKYRHAVISLYGTAAPSIEPTPVVFVPASKLVRPIEAPDLVLLPVDKEKGENPMQVKSLWFFAPYLAGGAAAAGIAFLLLGVFLGRKKPAPPAA
jgi:hypothetical protein